MRRVAAEPLDDAGARLRDDPDRPREHEEHERRRRQRARSDAAIRAPPTRRRARSRPRSSRLRPVVPGSSTWSWHERARRPLLAADLHATAVPSTRWSTTALAPVERSRAGAERGGMCRCRARDRAQDRERRERRRRTKTMSCEPDGAPTSGDDRRGNGGERHGTEEEEPRRQDLADGKRDSGDRPSEPRWHERESTAAGARAAAGGPRDPSRRGSNSGWSPKRSTRIARMPIARAPSMSSASVSPTITASAGSTSSRSSTARKIDSCGFVLPWWNELMPASTSSA